MQLDTCRSGQQICIDLGNHSDSFVTRWRPFSKIVSGQQLMTTYLNVLCFRTTPSLTDRKWSRSSFGSSTIYLLDSFVRPGTTWSIQCSVWRPSPASKWRECRFYPCVGVKSNPTSNRRPTQSTKRRRSWRSVPIAHEWNHGFHPGQH